MSKARRKNLAFNFFKKYFIKKVEKVSNEN